MQQEAIWHGILNSNILYFLSIILWNIIKSSMHMMITYEDVEIIISKIQNHIYSIYNYFLMMFVTVLIRAIKKIIKELSETSLILMWNFVILLDEAN